MNNFQNTVSFALIQATNTFRVILEKNLNAIGLHSGQIFLMISLWENDGQSQIDLANNLKLSAPTVNKMTKSLLNGGFVECRKCVSDARLMRVFLTAKGISIQAEVSELWSRVEGQVFNNITETEKLILTQLLGKLREQLLQNKSYEYR